jgi:hypothetical protein
MLPLPPHWLASFSFAALKPLHFATQCLQALSDITVNLLSTSPCDVNKRLLQKCCSQAQRSATSTGAELLLRPSTKDLLTSVGRCVQGVLHDAAVMGAAQQPAAWMPEKASLLASVGHFEHRVQGAVEDTLSRGLLQQDMGTFIN